jgi:hypothetical protein
MLQDVCLEALDDAISFERRHEDVETPQTHKEDGCGVLGLLGTTQLSAD